MRGVQLLTLPSQKLKQINLSTYKKISYNQFRFPMKNSSVITNQRVKLIERHFSSSRPNTTTSTTNHSQLNLTEPSVIDRIDNNLRLLTLNRPKALNALNAEMIDILTKRLIEWEQSPEANLIIMKANGRAFCAGGDVIALIEAVASNIKQKRISAVEYFQKEYSLNSFLSKMKTPVICFMDGITMGGGLGLCMHVPFRIATENTRVAMPETTIGLFPDVGATFFLPRMDGELGTYLGLTSTNLYGWGAFQSGIASHFVPSTSLGALQERLSNMSGDLTLDRINDTINEFSCDIIESKTSSSIPYDLVGIKRQAIDYCFSGNTVEEIINKLLSIENGQMFKNEDLENWAKDTKDSILNRSPTSCKLTLMALREGKKLNIDECVEMELRLGATCCDINVHKDLVTGVQHLLINKKKSRPDWKPNKLEEVNLKDIQNNFFSLKSIPTTTHLLPFIHIPTHRKPFKTYPHLNYSLPNEEIVKNYVLGKHKDSSSFALNKNELIKLIQSKYPNKIGVKEKIEDILFRLSFESSEKEGKVLKWIY
ncbi:hypothetical protein CROQUDRAFT_131532 [Cronartium quercuum f. sp. fusiforme G11]|uniref:3-hydroxyisobutyryl-CoA hydrolase n=1 Tax=Cronartium quercuum f. sp. fusiforme G11 TaxID=708437 RepID=A0A9P6NL15_9BASI|nr:hypothetical protein CROQUDRAFT_131532 [Cronartium quercuum f. sp. fusiforme G11]